MRIALVIKHSGFLRYVQTQVEELCSRGHAIHIAIQDAPIKDEDGLLAELSAQFPKVTVGYALPRSDHWARTVGEILGALDYARYLHPDYGRAAGLRERMRSNAGRMGIHLHDAAWSLGLGRNSAASKLGLAALRGILASTPPSQDILSYLRQLDLDLLLVTGLVWPRSGQADYVLAARELGIRTGYIVNSWDNLTNKGDVKAQPDSTFVWNEQQKREAVEHHGLRAESVHVVGASLFDRWFERAATESRSDFVRRVGLRDDRPFVLYACSSPAIAPKRSEVVFFRNWLQALRTSAPFELRKANVIVRPHPFNAEVWANFNCEDSRVTVHPRHGRWIVQEDDRSDYYHALKYAAVVVGINTSAMVEAAILGARTLSVRSGKFASAQDGTLHFHHLTSLGIVQVHDSLSDHFDALREQLAQPHAPDRASLPGVNEFVRPQGREQPATQIAVAAIEAQEGRPARRPGIALAWRPVAYALRASGQLAVLARGRGRKPSKKAATNVDILDPRRQPTGLQRFFGRSVFPRLVNLSLRLHPSPAVRSALSDQLGLGELDRFSEVEQALAKAAEGERPIFVGPWLSEVGFETLYWIPFIRWFRKHAGIDRDRMVVISRGGAQFWYSSILGKYVDIFDLYTPAQFQGRNLERSVELGHQKQSQIGQFDADILERVAERLGVSEYNVLHPSTMNRLFHRYWKDFGGFPFINSFTRFEPLQLKPSRIEKACAGLPRRFVAAKFYFRESLPDTPENRELITEIITRMSEHIDVVLLSASIQLDDHRDFHLPRSPRIHVVDHMYEPSRNLDVQSCIISRSEAFVGTYGGMTYVANLLGKTSICFESVPQFNRPMHTELAHRKLRQYGGNLHVLRPEDLEMFQWLLTDSIRSSDKSARPAA